MTSVGADGASAIIEPLIAEIMEEIAGEDLFLASGKRFVQRSYNYYRRSVDNTLWGYTNIFLSLVCI